MKDSCPENDSYHVSVRYHNLCLDMYKRILNPSTEPTHTSIQISFL